MSFYNHVVLVGRLTRDLELRQTPQGTSVTTMRLAVNRLPARDGSQGVDFLDVVLWSKLADTCTRMLHKGNLVLVEGSLRQRTYTDKTGQNRKVVEVLGRTVRFLDRKEAGVRQEEESEVGDTMSLEESEDIALSPMLENFEEEDA